jgi:hypothetical protein
MIGRRLGTSDCMPLLFTLIIHGNLLDDSLGDQLGWVMNDTIHHVILLDDSDWGVIRHFMRTWGLHNSNDREVQHSARDQKCYMYG